MTFGAASLGAVLAEHLPPSTAGILVALSGGGDSACLLTAMAQLRAPGDSILRGRPLRALHVDHGLQAASVAMSEACRKLCAALDVPLSIVTVRIEADGASLEAAARDARYQALRASLGPNECLLTAHHAQDQAETLLLQLLRGAGLKGLAAMPWCKPFGGGWHVRPMLEATPRELQVFAQAHAVAFVQDPMNADLRFDRAYLRSVLWPHLESRWPGTVAALARSASHLADAQQQLDVAAAAAIGRLRDGEALSVTGLRSLSRLEQVNTLRHWLHAAGAELPSTARLTEGLRQMLDAKAGQQPAVMWGRYALRRYRERMFLTPAAPPSMRESRDWPRWRSTNLDLGPAMGALSLVPVRGGLDPERLPDTLTVRPRRGGESLKVGRARTHTVQHLCQSMGVLPWMRDALPMLYAGETLIGVADLWLDARWCVAPDAPGLGCRWQGGPQVA